MGYVFAMYVVSILPYAEFGPNDHRGDAPHFNLWYKKFCFHTTKEMMSMLVVVAADITVTVPVNQNLFEKLESLYSLRLVAHIRWSLWDLAT